jgi:hypothetical protein
MPRKITLLNIVNFTLSALVLLCTSCTGQESTKAKGKKNIPGENAETTKIIQIQKDDKEFSLLLDKLKEKNPFSRNHAEISKYRFKSGNLTLSGIFYDTKKPLALINDEMVSEGQIIDGKRVIKITPNEVILTDQEREYRLKTE